MASIDKTTAAIRWNKIVPHQSSYGNEGRENSPLLKRCSGLAIPGVRGKALLETVGSQAVSWRFKEQQLLSYPAQPALFALNDGKTLQSYIFLETQICKKK